MTRPGAGWDLPRGEDEALLQGRGRYVGDLRRPAMLHLAFLRAPHAHARLLRLDLAGALRKPGVAAAVGAAELAAAGIGALPASTQFKGPDGAPAALPARPLLGGPLVRHVGEAVAVVAADSRWAAEDAVEAIAADYEALPAVTDVLDPAAAVVCAARFGDPAATAAAFAAAAQVVELRLRNQRLVPCAMEPRGILAEPDPRGRLTLHLPSQNPSTVRQTVATLLGRSPESVRVLVPAIGGAFGMKSYLYPEEAVAAWLAARLGRPLRWIATRAEEMLSGTHARDQVTTAALALDAEGRILALRSRTRCNLGAYPNPAGPHVALVLGPKVATGAYVVPAAEVETLGLLTNTQATAPYRGAGRPEAIYVIERLVEAAARARGEEPLALRLRNLVPPGQSYVTPLGEHYEPTDLPGLVEAVQAAGDWAGFADRRTESEARGFRRGRGLCLFVEWTGGSAAKAQHETVRLGVEPDGALVLEAAVIPMGQGIATTLTQLVAAAFELPAERVRVETGDTDQLEGYGSFASRSLSVGGGAALKASEALRERLREAAARLLEAAAADIAYAAGEFRVAGTDRALTLGQIAAAAPDEASLQETCTVGGPTWPAGAYLCEVEVDPASGAVRMDRFTAVDDLGVVYSPAIVEGQVQGGIAQGLGQALLEHGAYNDEGQLIAGSFMDYALPRAGDLPAIATQAGPGWPSRNNPLGSKGAGESGTVGATPAAVLAVLDALAPLGVRDIALPLTPERVWRAVREATG